MSSRQVLDGTRRGWCSDTSSTVASGWPSGDAGSSPSLKTPALFLSPLLLLEYQLLRQAQDRLRIWPSGNSCQEYAEWWNQPATAVASAGFAGALL